MTNNEIYKVVKTAIDANGVESNKGNQEWLELIQNPPKFYSFTPCGLEAIPQNEGELAWQCKLYNNETRWYDMEVPVGQENNNINPRKVDMVGYDGSSYILCELKYADAEYINTNDSPFDALLQLLAYYVMLQQNAATLDEKNVHHTDAHKTDFRWQDVCQNAKLLLKAPPKYWAYWNDNPNGYEKSKRAEIPAMKEIIAQCGKAGLRIEKEKN